MNTTEKYPKKYNLVNHLDIHLKGKKVKNIFSALTNKA